jgi:LemA protein
MIIVWIILGLIILIFLVVISIYNGLVKKKNNVKEAWSSIDVFLKKRNDIIPNLVEVVKGYASHESNTLQKVIEARNICSKANSAGELSSAEKTMQGAMLNLFAISENYPELKANSNFLSLQQELSSMEDEIEMARRYFNGVVKENNDAIETFPSNLIAKMFGFTQSDFFEIQDVSEREAVKVKF